MSEVKHALVFGASGVSGWAFVNELLNNYPKNDIWGSVTALTNRPLSLEKSRWPKDARLSIVSGIDILAGSQQDLENRMRSKITFIESVSHVFYVAYKAQTDLSTEFEENTEMLQRAITAVDRLSSSLEHIVVQTGSKAYGCHLLHNRPELMKTPLSETLPRLPAPWNEGLFYHPQLDWLKDYSKGKKWGWVDTRPDIIVGFVPNQNSYSLGTVLGIYLSLRREIDGEGAECPFPGTDASWTAISHDSSAEMIARESIYLSLTSPWKNSQEEAFNVADAKDPSCWKHKWPAICSYFGLKGVKLAQDNPVEVRTYIREHIDVWNAMEKKYGLQSGHADSPRTFPGFEYFLLTQFDFDRHFDMSKLYETAGFAEQRSTIQAWGSVFDHMREAGVIPKAFSQ